LTLSVCSAARLCALILITVVSHAADLNDPEIQAKLARGKMVVEVHKIPGTHILEGRVAGVVDAAREQVWAALSDNEHITEFMPRMKESFLVRPEAVPEIARARKLKEADSLLYAARIYGQETDTCYIYDVFDFPFPVSDRRTLVQLINGPEEFSSYYTQILGDFRVNEGTWKMLPYGEGRTLAIYTLRTDPGIAVPGFLIRLGTRYAMPDVIKGLRKHVKEMFPERARP
jgi:hypothetical protein